MPKNIMKEFLLDEISLVDLPAQEGALALLIKHQDRQPVREPESELAKAIKVFLATHQKPSVTKPEIIKKEEVMTGPASFEAAVEMFKSRGMKPTDAMRKAADEHPALFAKFQSRTTEPAAQASSGEPIAKFRRLVDEIAKRDSCPATKAMQRAAAEHPEVFAEYRAA